MAGIGAAAAALAAAVVLFASAGGSSPNSGGTGASPGSSLGTVDSHEVASGLLNHFAVLRDSRAPFGDLPGWARAQIESRASGLGLDTSDVGQAEPSSDIKAWFIPGTTGDCVFEANTRSNSGTGSCGPISVSGEFWPSAGLQGGSWGERTVGFVRDGIRTVTVHLFGGHTFRVRVKDNAYEAKAAERDAIASISTTTPAGKTITLPGG
jgi:hypothetical protein